MGVDVSFEGIAELVDEIEREVVAFSRVENDALIAGAVPICMEARKTGAFIDRTGKLRNSIQISEVKQENKRKYVLVEATDPIAKPVEYGHGGPHAASAHPFLEPAYNRRKYESHFIIAAKLREALNSG